MRSRATVAVLLLALSACSGEAADTTPDDAAPVDGADAALADGSEDAAEAATDAADEAADAAEVDAAPDADPFADAAIPDPVAPGTWAFTLQNGAYPNSGHPDAAVHLPTGFRADLPFGAIVFFHGFNNCVVNVLGSVDTACTTGGAKRASLHLADQLDAARVNAILIAIELKYDQATGDPGALATKGRLAALLHELLADHLSPIVGRAIDVGDLERIVLGSHSGGYWATAMAISVGGVAPITEVDLYDSLYGYTTTFDGWVKGGILQFNLTRADELRWADVYTSGGGTAANSTAMASRASGWLSAVGLSSSLFFDDTTAALATTDDGHPVLYKRTSVTHDGVPRTYFGRFAQQAGFYQLP